MTDDLRALLEELREIDIETWKDVRHQLINIFVVDRMSQIVLRTPIENYAYQDIIQGCIQRAICQMPECHGLLQWDGMRAVARIYKHVGDFFQPEMIAESDAYTPTAAILAAYLAARKAMR